MRRHERSAMLLEPQHLGRSESRIAGFPANSVTARR